MKNRMMKYVLVIVITMMACINVFNAQKTEGLSDVALANVEALAQSEVTWENRTPSDVYKSLELLGNGCTRITYERFCAYGGSSPCTTGIFTEVDCLR